MNGVVNGVLEFTNAVIFFQDFVFLFVPADRLNQGVAQGILKSAMRTDLPLARKWGRLWGGDKMDCAMRWAGFVSPGCQGPWRFGKRTPPGLDRSNGSLSGLAADSLAALFLLELVGSRFGDAVQGRKLWWCNDPHRR